MSPTYEYECGHCGNIFDESHLMKDSAIETKCKCGEVADKHYGVARTHVFEKRIFEHLGAEPVMIESKQQLKKECISRGIDPQRVPALN